jgi:hypothetical protein
MIIGELSDADAIDSAVAGADVVVSALGPSLDRKATEMPLIEGTRHILDAMKRHGITRYIGHATPSILDPQEKPTLQTKLVGFMGRTGLPRLPGTHRHDRPDSERPSRLDDRPLHRPQQQAQEREAAGRVLRHRPHRIRRLPRRHRRIHRQASRRQQLPQPRTRDHQLTTPTTQGSSHA